MSYANPAAYEPFMGRWSARLTPSFLRFAQVKDGQHVLDVGCGTGILSRAIVSYGTTARVTGVDPLPEYIAFAQNAVPNPRARFEVGRAEALPFADKAFDAALALLVLQDFTDQVQAVHEMARVTHAGGMVAACIWDFELGLPMLSLLWQAAEAIAPDEVLRCRAGTRTRNPDPGDLETLWRECGLGGVTAETFEIAMPFVSFEDYWQPILGRSTPTSAFIAAIDGQTGGALSRVLREKIARFVQLDGSFVFPAHAWAIRGMARS